MVEIYGKSDRGNVRENNEDRICYPRPNTTSPTPPAGAGQLLMVADGVGGVQGGEHASRLTVETVKRAYYYGDHGQDPRWLLRRAIETANQEVLTYTSATPALRGAASTVTAAVIKDNQLVVANVGDSRTYVIRADGRSQQISIDHSLTQQKINQKLLDPTQAKSDIDSHVITRSIGLESTVEVDIFPPSTVQPPYILLAPGDAVLLCSDGLTDLVTDNEMARIVAANSPQKAVNQLIKLAKRNGGHDNISVIVGRVPGKGVSAGGANTSSTFANFAMHRRLWLLLIVLLLVSAIGLALRSVWPVGEIASHSAVQTVQSEPLTSLTPIATMTVAIGATQPLDEPAVVTMPTVTRVAAQDTVAATPAPTPAVTTTRANAPTLTPTLIPAASPVLVSQPELVAPEPDYTIIGDIETLFVWKWTGTLAPDQGFEILFWPLDQPSDKRGIHNARETQTLTPDSDGIYRLSKKVSERGPGNYAWTVAVVRLNSYQRLAEAPSRPIKISSSGGSEPKPGAAGPRP